MLTLAEIADATDGALTGDPSLEVTAVCTDTRAIVPGCLFVALKGANYDGHAFAAQAVREQLSQDTWLVMSRLEHTLAHVRPEDDLQEILMESIEAFLALSG
ncbi:MAG: Mur ligase domain-containing protein, partial [Candidatus Sericytochromatia bacterium]